LQNEKPTIQKEIHLTEKCDLPLGGSTEKGGEGRKKKKQYIPERRGLKD